MSDDELVGRLTAISAEMASLGTDMADHSPEAEAHGRELISAAEMIRQWVEAIQA